MILRSDSTLQGLCALSSSAPSSMNLFTLSRLEILELDEAEVDIMGWNFICWILVAWSVVSVLSFHMDWVVFCCNGA